MTLEDLFESAALSTCRTVWTKHGPTITEHEIEQIATTDIAPRSRITLSGEPADHGDDR